MARVNRKAFLHKEDGSMSVLSVFMVLISLTVGALSYDIHRLMVERTRLQNAVDTAAHAALYTREDESAHEAITLAVATTDSDSKAWKWRQPISAHDIEYGYWDNDTRTFTADSGSKDAVFVKGYRVKSRYNEISTVLLTLVGIDEVELAAEAVYETYYPACMTEGLVAEGVVDLQSNNTVVSGFCIHSNSHVSVNQNNYFEPGTVVQMPDISEIDLPRSGFKKNDGLEQALRNGSFRVRAVNMIDDILTGLENMDSDYLPDYVSGSNAIELSTTSVLPSDFTYGRAHKIDCPSGGTLVFGKGDYSGFSLWTSCKVKFNQGTTLQDVTIGTTDSDADSFSAPSTLVVGLDDNCADGGGASLVTLGGFQSAADLHMYGSQVLAKGDIEFAANADGIEGTSMISAGEISATSNSDFGYCDHGGMDDIYRARLFRMVL